MEINGIDVLLILVILLALFTGWRRGFIYSALGLVAWAGSLFVAWILYQAWGQILGKIFPSLGAWLLPVSFLSLLIPMGIFFFFVARKLLLNTPASTHFHPVNRALGVLPGLVYGILWGTIITILLVSFPISNQVASSTRDSKIASRLSQEASWLEHKISPIFDEAINESISRFTVKPAADKTYELNFTVSDARIRRDLEKKMLEMVNAERQKHGLKALTWDEELSQVARKHSNDMFERGYFAHYTPEGGSPFDRMKKDKVIFLTAGENLALAQTLNQAHVGLMNSPGHRANILHPAFGRLGIGVLDGGIYGLMITQNFRN